jgi:hypothetical protein
MELLAIGFATGLLTGVAGGTRVNRKRLARAQEKIAYAARELDRRKHGALAADLRAKRGAS